jgi:proton-translocating NADH-quinone oxidoreductase chain N
MTLLAYFIGLPFIASPLVYVAGHQPSFLQWINVRRLSLLALVILWLLLLSIGQRFDAVQPLTYTVGVIQLKMDGLSLLMSSLALLLATLTIIFSMRDIDGQMGAEKYYAMVFALTGMVIGLVCAGDLFNLWIWFEGTAISSYLLVAFYHERDNAMTAGVKYFIQTASGSIFVLFGIALVFLHNGTLDLASMQPAPQPLLIVAGALFVMGFGVKAALFPSYTWLPDAYAESPTGIAALLSGVVTVTAIIALLKAMAVIVWDYAAWGNLLLIIATFNIVVGNMLAVAQTQVNRILAYSSISHIGYIVLAIGIGISTQSLSGMRGTVLHIFVHGLMKALAFFAVGALAYAVGRHQTRQLTLHDLRGAGQRYPMIALALVISLLSLAGVPLLAGFISKLQIFAGVQNLSGGLNALIVFAALNTVFSLVYYLPVINALYSHDVHPHWQAAPALPLSLRIPIFVLVMGLVVLGIFPNLIDSLVNPAAATLLAMFTAGGQ